MTSDNENFCSGSTQDRRAIHGGTNAQRVRQSLPHDVRLVQRLPTDTVLQRHRPSSRSCTAG